MVSRDATKLSSDEWYSLGTEIGELTNDMLTAEEILLELGLPKHDKLYKKFYYFNTIYMIQLKSVLDDLIQNAYPPSINVLPNHHVKLVEVFYNLVGNRANYKSNNSVHKISSADKNFIFKILHDLDKYINKIHLIKSDNKYINKDIMQLCKKLHAKIHIMANLASDIKPIDNPPFLNNNE